MCGPERTCLKAFLTKLSTLSKIKSINILRKKCTGMNLFGCVGFAAVCTWLGWGQWDNVTVQRRFFSRNVFFKILQGCSYYIYFYACKPEKIKLYSTVNLSSCSKIFPNNFFTITGRKKKTELKRILEQWVSGRAFTCRTVFWNAILKQMFL